MKAKQVFYEGHVQGVGFRYTTREIAKGFDVVGWVKNLADGRVELQAMGDEDELEEFLCYLREESELAANIKGVVMHDVPLLEGVQGFRIVR